MLEYLKRAFWARFDIAGLGRVPVNVLGLVGFAVLGFGHPAFWLLGTGLEVGYLALVSTHPRFQKAVRAQLHAQSAGDAELRREDLLRKLDPASRARYTSLEAKCRRVMQLAEESHTAAFGLESSRDALDRLCWIYLKLLVARFHLESSRVATSESSLQQKVSELEGALAAAGLSPALRESQSATLEIMRQRLQNLQRCAATLKEVDSDLARIEAQTDLALDNANLRGSGAVVSANLELASHILDDGLYFGDAEADVAALDEAYSGTSPRVRQ